MYEKVIEEMMYFVWIRMKIVVEPSAVVALAAYQKLGVQNKKIGVVLSGGNVDVRKVETLFQEIQL